MATRNEGRHLENGTLRGNNKDERNKLGLRQAFVRCFLPGLEENKKGEAKWRRGLHTVLGALIPIILCLPWFQFPFYLASKAGQEVVVKMFWTCWDVAGKQTCARNVGIPLTKYDDKVVLPSAVMPITLTLWAQGIGGIVLPLGSLLAAKWKGSKFGPGSTNNRMPDRLGWRNLVQLVSLMCLAILFFGVAMSTLVPTFGMAKSGGYMIYALVMAAALFVTGAGTAYFEWSFRRKIRNERASAGDISEKVSA